VHAENKNEKMAISKNFVAGFGAMLQVFGCIR